MVEYVTDLHSSFRGGLRKTMKDVRVAVPGQGPSWVTIERAKRSTVFHLACILHVLSRENHAQEFRFLRSWTSLNHCTYQVNSADLSFHFKLVVTLHGRNRAVHEGSLPLLIFVKYSHVRNILQSVLELYKKRIFWFNIEDLLHFVILTSCPWRTEPFAVHPRTVTRCQHSTCSPHCSSQQLFVTGCDVHQ